MGLIGDSMYIVKLGRPETPAQYVQFGVSWFTIYQHIGQAQCGNTRRLKPSLHSEWNYQSLKFPNLQR